ncbi:MAG: putative metallo-dependent phosphatase [Frankiales bacterium]|nr:putative metallo-dependent phosphatase [Frankiales bacterium]
MRLGIVSDVHGNAAGLARALERMGDVDQLWCAGDVVEEFRFSNEAVGLLRERDARCVLGNHDQGLLGPHGVRARAAEHVDRGLLVWLASRPTTVDETFGATRVLMTHASPCHPHTQYVLPRSPEVRRIDGVADVVIIGHTHKQMIVRLEHTLVINPGSVGQARDPANGKQLSYAVLDVTTGEVAIDDYTCGPALHAVPSRAGRSTA